MAAYVQIVVPEAWTSEQFRSWYDCVEHNVPTGMIVSTNIQGKDKILNSKFFHKPTPNGKHAYVVPLARDLDPSEIHQLVKHWVKCYPEGDFTLDYSQSSGKALPETPFSSKLSQVIDAWAKAQHQMWMEKKLEQGWRYGLDLNLKQRTHPWLVPYESLPPHAQERDLHAVEQLMSLLDKFGYAIIQKPQA